MASKSSSFCFSLLDRYTIQQKDFALLPRDLYLRSNISINVPNWLFSCVLRERSSLLQVLALHCVRDLHCVTEKITKCECCYVALLRTLCCVMYSVNRP